LSFGRRPRFSQSPSREGLPLSLHARLDVFEKTSTIQVARLQAHTPSVYDLAFVHIPRRASHLQFRL
jgi:hypothetical protein